MLKKVIAVAAFAGAAALIATPASAEIFCATVDVTVNDVTAAQTVCTPA